MPSSDWSNSIVLAEWADSECRHIDLIASWEELMNAYQVLGFTGPDTDEERLAEFKLVVGETNKFLSRMKNGLAKTSSLEDAIDYLALHINTADMNQVKVRPSIVYNKLKQKWLYRAISTLRDSISDEPLEGERDVD